MRDTTLKEGCISPALGCDLRSRGFGQVSLMVDLDGNLSLRVTQVCDDELLHQDHRNIAAAFLRRAAQRIGELLDFIADGAFLQDRCDDRQAIRQSLSFPRVGDSLCQVAKIVPEAQFVLTAQVAPNARAAVDAELGDCTVPGDAHDMTREWLRRVHVLRAAHVLPPGRALFIGRLRLSVNLIQNAFAPPWLQLHLMLVKGGRCVADGQIDVE